MSCFSCKQRDNRIKALRNDLKKFKEHTKFLYKLLDDIDTAGDMAKNDDKLYRKLVEKYQARKNESGIYSDGFKLNFESGFKPDYSKIEMTAAPVAYAPDNKGGKV